MIIKPKIQMKQTVELITPDIAKKMLAHNAPNNRPITEIRAAEFEKLNRAGEMRTTPEGIMVDTEGYLIDGQHRLTGIVRGGNPVWMVVWRDVPFELMRVVNTGRSRTVADTVSMLGIGSEEVNNAKLVARANAVYLMHHPEFGGGGGRSSLEQFETVTKKLGYMDSLVWSLRNFNPSSKNIGGLAQRFRSAVIMGSIIVAHKMNPERTEVFARKVDTGLDLYDGDPAYTLRKYLDGCVIQSRGSERVTQARAALRCVYAGIHGQNIKFIQTSMLTKEHPEFRKVLRYFNLLGES